MERGKKITPRDSNVSNKILGPGKNVVRNTTRLPPSTVREEMQRVEASLNMQYLWNNAETSSVNVCANDDGFILLVSENAHCCAKLVVDNWKLQTFKYVFENIQYSYSIKIFTVAFVLLDEKFKHLKHVNKVGSLTCLVLTGEHVPKTERFHQVSKN